jgi:serine/threonine-protein kinase
MKQTSLPSVAALLAELARHPLLKPDQLAELSRFAKTAGPQAKQFCQELLRRGWLTTFQINQLVKGEAAELVLGPYLLLDRLGAGGMGQVYKARHLRLDRIEAVKVIRPDLLASPGVLQRFQREARAAAQLSHVNIVAVRHADEVGGRHFLVMEYVEGTDLGQLVGKDGPLPVGLACDLIRQAALGLQHAHERGLVHRDIKPSNLLLVAEGSVVKVADLGLALWRPDGESHGSASQISLEGTALGTLDFMAPEQGLDAHTVDIRADIYSLGCTLHYLLTGGVIFPGGSALQKLLRHQQSEPEPIERLRTDLPGELPPVLRRMLVKDPAGRFQTPAEVARALAPLSAQQPSPATRSPRRARTAPATPTNAVAEQTTSGWQPPATMPTASTQAPKPSRERPVPAKDPFPATVLPDRSPGTDPGRRVFRRYLLLASALVLGGGLAWYLWPRRGEPPIGDNQESPPSLLDRLQPDAIPAAERFPWQPPELIALLGTHFWRDWAGVRGVALSPDDRTAASCGEDGRIVLRNTSSGKVLATLTGHTGIVAGVAFAPRAGSSLQPATTRPCGSGTRRPGRRRLSSTDTPRRSMRWPYLRTAPCLRRPAPTMRPARERSGCGTSGRANRTRPWRGIRGR